MSTIRFIVLILCLLAVGNLILFARFMRLHLNCNCRSKERKPSAGSGSARLIVVDNEELEADAATIFTVKEKGVVHSLGARGTALDGGQVTAKEGSDTLAMEGSTVLSLFGSTTVYGPGSAGRVKGGAEAHIKSGVRAYARAGSVIIDRGCRISLNGCPTVLEGLEPARVVAESGATIYGYSGAEIIAEPDVTIRI